jgi:pimeloyl-ACP methyl ester carboxylesterase
MKILTVSGWCQVPDALNCALPSGAKFQNFAYSSLPDLRATTVELEGINCDIAVGWSLGGKILANAISQKIISPRLLVLLGTPFQYIPTGGIQNVIRRSNFQTFEQAFSTSPDEALSHFLDAIVAGDSSAALIRQRLVLDRANDHHWSRWLAHMKFGCENFDFAEFPMTLIVHGQNDCIINLEQPRLFASAIEKSSVEILPSCGHAPHLHDPDMVRMLVENAWKGVTSWKGRVRSK